MKTVFGKGVFLGLIIAVSIVACSAGGDGDDNEPIVFKSYAYAVNFNSNDISAFSINASTGALTSVAGSPFAVGEQPQSVAVDPTHKFAYVGHLWSGALSAFTINAATGALTAIAGSPFMIDGHPTSFSFVPSGKFVYVSAGGNVPVGSGYVFGFSIDAATGALTPLAGSPFVAGNAPSSVAVDPSGRYLYVANFDSASSNVSAYTINATTGALTPVAGSPYAANDGPSSVAVDPSGKFVYAAQYWSGVAAYSIDAATGALTPVAGSPFAPDERPVLSPSTPRASSSIWPFLNMSPPLPSIRSRAR